MTWPVAYAWLGQVQQLPRLVAAAGDLYALHEGPGLTDNPTILKWAADLGLTQYVHDSTAWCGLFAAHLCQITGKPVPKDPLWALNWANFGVPSPTPGLGDIMVFKRFDRLGHLIGGHVGLYVAEDDAAFHILGGNTGDQVAIARLARGRLHAARRPVYQTQPASVRPYRVAPTGALSTNEA